MSAPAVEMLRFSPHHKRDQTGIDEELETAEDHLLESATTNEWIGTGSFWNFKQAG